MLEHKSEDIQFRRYLRLLGIEKQRPGFEYLKNILNTHFSRIPFENISKLYFKKQIGLNSLIDFELFLDGIEQYGFGGTCYASNFYINQLLSWLGFEIKLCGASIKNPDVHIVNIVSLQGSEFLIDMGYAAPFIEPLPLNLSVDYTIRFGNDRYVLKPQNKYNQHQIELYRKGELIHGYTVNPQAKTIDDFSQVIEDSFMESSTFMKAILLTRYDSGNFITIHNMDIIVSSKAGSDIHTVDTLEQLALVINKYFNIPESIVLECADIQHMQVDGWS